MMQAITAILALAKAVPILDKYLEMLLVQYAIFKKDKITKENRDAIRQAIESQDQRPLESQEHSGVHSGVGNTVDHVRGVE